jgi:hypothetical protein
MFDLVNYMLRSDLRKHKSDHLSLSYRSGRQPKTYVKPEAAITAPGDGRCVARNMLSN